MISCFIKHVIREHVLFPPHIANSLESESHTWFYIPVHVVTSVSSLPTLSSATTLPTQIHNLQNTTCLQS